MNLEIRTRTGIAGPTVHHIDIVSRGTKLSSVTSIDIVWSTVGGIMTRLLVDGEFVSRVRSIGYHAAAARLHRRAGSQRDCDQKSVYDEERCGAHSL